MPTGRRPPLSQKSLDFMRSQFNSPTQPPERPTKQQRVARLLQWTTFIAIVSFVLCLLLGLLIWLADLVLGTKWIDTWALVLAGSLLFVLLNLLPERIRTAPAKAVLLGIGIVTLAHALYVAILHQQSPLALSRVAMIAAGLLLLWKAIDLYHEHVQQPTRGAMVFGIICVLSGFVSFGLAALYAYPTVLNMTVDQLRNYPFPFFAITIYNLINFIHPDKTTANSVNRKTSQ